MCFSYNIFTKKLLTKNLYTSVKKFILEVIFNSYNLKNAAFLDNRL